MKAPFVKLFIKDFAFDIAGMTDAEIGKMMKAAIETYRSGKTPEKYENFSIFKSISDANVNYLTICERNRQNRTKSNTYVDQSSTSRQPVVDQSSTSLVNQNQNQNQNKDKEKNIIKKEPDLSFVTDEFKEVFLDWLAYRKQSGKALKPVSYKMAYKNMLKLANESPEIARKIVNNSISCGYQGLFPLQSIGKQTTVKHTPKSTHTPDGRWSEDIPL